MTDTADPSVALLDWKKIADAIRPCRPVRQHDDALLVPTDVLLPNGATVLVFVQGKANGRVTAMDGGAALHQVSDSGRDITEAVYTAARSAARNFGLTLEGTVLRSHPEDPSDARAAVLMLANGARAVADAALKASHKQATARFRDRVGAEIRRIFSNERVRAHAELRGESEERHYFDWVIRISAARQLILDAPVPEHSSIAATLLRHLDLARARRPDISQAITYSEEDGWQASELTQLRLANVRVIAAPALEATLREMAEAPA